MTAEYFTSYVTDLASNKNYSVPYKAIEANIRRYITAEFLPARFRLREPSKLTKVEICLLLRHIILRQESNGIQQAFRFRAFTNMKGEEYPAEYPDMCGRRHEPETSTRAKNKNGKVRSMAGRVAGKETESPQSPLQNIDPVLLMNSNPMAAAEHCTQTAGDQSGRCTAGTAGGGSSTQLAAAERTQTAGDQSGRCTAGEGSVTQLAAAALSGRGTSGEGSSTQSAAAEGTQTAGDQSGRCTAGEGSGTQSNQKASEAADQHSKQCYDDAGQTRKRVNADDIAAKEAQQYGGRGGRRKITRRVLQ